MAAARGTPKAASGSVQKSVAIVQRFEELRGSNKSAVIFPHQLADVRQAANHETGAAVSSMAPFFVQRVFEVHVCTTCPATGQLGMSLTEFSDFLLAWNYRGFLPSTRCVQLLEASDAALSPSSQLPIARRSPCTRCRRFYD